MMLRKITNTIKDLPTEDQKSNPIYCVEEANLNIQL